jgi:hypothetical protein
MTPRAQDPRRRTLPIASAVIATALIASGCGAQALESVAMEPTVAGGAQGTAAASSRLTPSVTPSAAPSAAAPTTPITPPAEALGTIAEILAVDEPSGAVMPITCDGNIDASASVAIVWVQTGDADELQAPVLRDYSDVTRPRTACTFGRGDYWIHSLVDARHIVIGGPNQAYAIVDLPAVRYHWFDLPASDDAWYSTLNAVAPDLRSATWTRNATDGSLARQILMTDVAGDHLLSDLPALEGGRCGSPLDSSSGAYARSGGAYYVLDQLIPQVNVLVAGRGTDAELTLYPPEAGWDDASMPLMALWAPTADELYYRVGSDVMRWRPGSDPELFLANTPWSHPSFTPDGRYLAYATDEGVYLMDLSGDSAPELIRAAASVPVFLNSTQLWYRASDEGGCITDETHPYVYDTVDDVELPSIIDNVLAIWPGTSSNSH